MTLRIPVNDILHIAGHGTVLVGEILEGSVTVGDRVSLCDGNEFVTASIVGLEVERQSVLKAVTGQHVGLLIHDFDPAELPSGFSRTEGGGYLVVTVTIKDGPRKWWMFW